MPALQPYWGKPAVRNDRGDRGNVGIIRSPLRASILPDHGYVAASLCGSCCRLPLPQREPITVAHHGDVALMEGFQRRAVTDGDDGGLWQLPRQQGVQISFRGLVKRGGRL